MKDALLYQESLGGFWRAAEIENPKSVESGINIFMKNYDPDAELLENNSENMHDSNLKYQTSKGVKLKFSWMCQIKILSSGDDEACEGKYKSLKNFLK